MRDVLLFCRAGHLRGMLAEVPLREGLQVDMKPWIACRMPDGVVMEDLPIEQGSCVWLKLDQLMERYPDTVETYTDEEGDEQKQTVHGYFHERGVSTSVWEMMPVIELSDVWWTDPQGVEHGK